MTQEQIGIEIENVEIYTQEDFNSDKFKLQKEFDLYNKIDPDLKGTAQFKISSLLKEKEKLENDKYLESVVDTSRDASALTAAIEMSKEQIGIEYENGEI